MLSLIDADDTLLMQTRDCHDLFHLVRRKVERTDEKVAAFVADLKRMMGETP